MCCLALVCTAVPSFAEDEKIPYEFNYGLDKPPYRWSPQTFPNPMIDVTKCGREGRRSYICDPNRVIDYQEGEENICIINLVAAGVVYLLKHWRNWIFILRWLTGLICENGAICAVSSLHT